MSIRTRVAKLEQQHQAEIEEAPTLCVLASYGQLHPQGELQKRWLAEELAKPEEQRRLTVINLVPGPIIDP